MPTTGRTVVLVVGGVMVTMLMMVMTMVTVPW